MRKEDLYKIATDTEIDLEYRYEAVRELQSRRMSGDTLINIVRWLPHKTVGEISCELNIAPSAINNVAKRLGLLRDLEGRVG